MLRRSAAESSLANDRGFIAAPLKALFPFGPLLSLAAHNGVKYCPPGDSLFCVVVRTASLRQQLAVRYRHKDAIAVTIQQRAIKGELYCTASARYFHT